MNRASRRGGSAAGIAALLLASAGCAGFTPPFAQIASRPLEMCRHCNCTMPADLEDHVMCPVCHCGLRVHQCRRGSR